MFDFRLFRDRTVRVRLKDGSRYLGTFHTILQGIDPTPSLWITDWFREHVLGLETIAEIELSEPVPARAAA